MQLMFHEASRHVGWVLVAFAEIAARGEGHLIEDSERLIEKCKTRLEELIEECGRRMWFDGTYTEANNDNKHVCAFFAFLFFAFCFSPPCFADNVGDLDDLAGIFPEQFKHLQYLKDKVYVEECVSLESLCLTFSCTKDCHPEYITPQGKRLHHQKK